MHKYMHGMSFKSAWLECKLNFISLSCTCSGLFFLQKFSDERRRGDVTWMEVEAAADVVDPFGNLETEF